MGHYPKIIFSGYAFSPYRAQVAVFLVRFVIYTVMGIIFRFSFKYLAIRAYIAVSTAIIFKLIF